MAGAWIVLPGRGSWWTQWGLYRGPGRFYTEDADLILAARKQRGVNVDDDMPAPAEGEPTEEWHERAPRTGPLTRADLSGSPPEPAPEPAPEPIEPVEAVAAADVEEASGQASSVVAKYAEKAGLEVPDASEPVAAEAAPEPTPEPTPDAAKPKAKGKKKEA